MQIVGFARLRFGNIGHHLPSLIHAHIGDVGPTGADEQLAVGECAQSAAVVTHFSRHFWHRADGFVVLAHLAVTKVCALAHQHVIAHLSHRIYLLPEDARFQHLPLLVVQHHIAEVGGKIHTPFRSEVHIVDGLGLRERGRLDFWKIDNIALTGDDVDIRIVVHHHQIATVIVVVDIANHHIIKVVGAVEALVFLSAFIEAIQTAAHQIIHLIAHIHHILCF